MLGKSAKEYYQTYLADDSNGELGNKLVDYIMEYSPIHVFEFGCGTGKILSAITNRSEGIVTCGLDISFLNIIHANVKNNRKFLILGDEYHLGHLCGFDVVFTCSVLDHIPETEFERIITEFKRIANKAVFLAETNDIVNEYYYKHDYEKYGFEDVGFSWVSPADKAEYRIWRYVK